MVMYKDPKMSKAVAGHAPGRRPLRGPFEVLAVKGNVATLRDPATKQVLKDIHGEFLLGVPGIVDDTERLLHVEKDDGQSRASAGQLVAARARAPAENPAAALPPRGRQRMRDSAGGRRVAYKGEGERRCRLGKVLSVAEDYSSLTVHVFLAEVDGRLQVKWLPAFDTQEGADFQTQRKETVEALRVLSAVTLNNGVLNHASSSQLNRAG